MYKRQVLTLILKEKEPFTAGINYTSKKILQAAVIFLGFGMNLSQILAGGKQSLPIIISTITTSLIIAFILYKALKLKTNNAILVGVGSSICGGSAIAATAPVIDATDEEVAQSISVIFLFNVLAALIFPTLGAVLGLSNEGFGLFAGTAINDTSSVTAAAAAWDGIHASHTLETATIVKMTRTLAIIPITLALAFYREKKEKKEEGSSFSFKKSFPFFVLFFILASVVTTIFHLPAAVTGPLKDVYKRQTPMLPVRCCLTSTPFPGTTRSCPNLTFRKVCFLSQNRQAVSTERPILHFSAERFLSRELPAISRPPFSVRLVFRPEKPKTLTERAAFY